MKRWFIPAAARARGQSNDLNREILASNLFNCHKEVINAPQVPSISRCIHIVYRHKNVWEYQWSNFIYNCMSTFLHYVHCKDALFDCSAPGGERCESLTWVDEITSLFTNRYQRRKDFSANCSSMQCRGMHYVINTVLNFYFIVILIKLTHSSHRLESSLATKELRLNYAITPNYLCRNYAHTIPKTKKWEGKLSPITFHHKLFD